MNEAQGAHGSRQSRAAEKRTGPSVRVLDKAVELLDALAAEGDLSVAAMSHRISEPRSTVYRLISSLKRHGFVEPGSARGTYRLGVRLFELGGAVLARFDVRHASLPVMERIHEATGETVFLCVRRGDEAVCIERIDGLHVQSLALRLGGSMPLHAGGGPRALLAFEPEEEWEAYISRSDLRRVTDKTVGDPDDLRRDLTAIRASGCAISDEDVTVGIAAMGAPVFDHAGRVCAALSISGLRGLILENNAPAMRELILGGTGEIGRALGRVPANRKRGFSRSDGWL